MPLSPDDGAATGPAGRGLASVIVVAHNSRKDLEESMPGLAGQSYGNYEIVVVDNNSTDGTADFIRANYPRVTLVTPGTNSGYAGGNNAGFGMSRGEYVVVVNPDVLVGHDWLEGLIRTLEDDPGAAMATSKIFEQASPEHAACGNIPHYTGLHFPRGLDLPAAQFSRPGPVAAVSGCSFAVRRRDFLELGGFDPDYFLYLEDSDISLRARIVGMRIVFTPDSRLVHKHKAAISTSKAYYLERNRYQLILKNYRLRVIVAILPALALTEVVTWGFAVLNGPVFVENKIRAYAWVVRNLGSIVDKRRRVMGTYRISDRELFVDFQWKIPFGQVVASKALSRALDLAFNPLFCLNYHVAKMLI